MKRLALLTLFLVSCGGGGQQSLSLPIAVTVDDLHVNVKAEYIQINGTLACDTPYQCGGVVAFDCQSKVDGPKNYYNNISGVLLMRCGGACLAPNPLDQTSCKACPPDEWVCKDI